MAVGSGRYFLRSGSGSFAIFAAIRLASSRVSRLGGCAPAGLGLEAHVSERWTIVVADDEAAAVVLFDIPGRREAARRHRQSPARGRCPGAASSPLVVRFPFQSSSRSRRTAGATGFLILSH